MRKQTAVEWLVDELRKHIQEHSTLDAITISKLKMEAKAMEKEQIEDAYEEGATDEYDPFDFNSGRKYYTSTYE